MFAPSVVKIRALVLPVRLPRGLDKGALEYPLTVTPEIFSHDFPTDKPTFQHMCYQVPKMIAWFNTPSSVAQLREVT